MATDRLPWLKFNTTDWRGDAKLRACSAAAQGVWINMLALMHESTPYGHLPVNPSDNPALLALQLGMRESDVMAGIQELEQHGVLSRTDDGAIFSRRMVRDAERAERNRVNGKSGGNPKLSPTDSVKPSDKASVKPSDKPAGARSRSGLSVSSSNTEGVVQPPIIDPSSLTISRGQAKASVGGLTAAWNLIAASHPPLAPVADDASTSRVSTALAMHPSIDWWANVFARVTKSDYCMGRKNAPPFTFWTVLDKADKIATGGYDNWAEKPADGAINGKPAPTPEEMTAEHRRRFPNVRDLIAQGKL
jgi:hypothetical protein